MIVPILALAAAVPASAQDAPQPDADRNFLQTIVDDVKSVVSTELETLPIGGSIH